MAFVQNIIALEDIWPCRRTRWWMIMVPKKYQICSILPFPKDDNVRRIGQLFNHWPRWTIEEEEALMLSEEELRYLGDAT